MTNYTLDEPYISIYDKPKKNWVDLKNTTYQKNYHKQNELLLRSSEKKIMNMYNYKKKIGEKSS